MKSIIGGLAATLAMAGTAIAGSAVYVPPVASTIEEPMRSGSGTWLIPLAIIAILALSLTNSEPRKKPA